MTLTRFGPVKAPAAGGPAGRQVVLLGEGAGRSGAAILRDLAGLRLAVSSDFDGPLPRAPIARGEGVLFERLGAAVVHGHPDQAQALARGSDGRRLLIESERSVRTSSSAALPLADASVAAWGLQASGALSSPYSGRGVRVAILDTGLALEHPDFSGRAIVTQSFVPGLAAGDRNGHGTFCAGVACGPERPADGPRYGVAFAAELFVAKVLDDDAGGTDGNILAGIDWAVRNDCAVVSMSVGSPVALGDSYPRVFEQIAARALAAGALLVAPAGNRSQRPETIEPVEHPANCPSILSVGAVDQSLEVAPFSNGGLNRDGGEVDLVAPGIAILSSSAGPSLYETGSGTSMAAPHVAGVAALLAEARPAARGAALRTLLLETLRKLTAPARDVGAGLVQAPR